MKMTLMSASAGSGKTYSLTEELYRSIDSKTAAPEQVIAVTFTRAAAAELKERVRNRLFEKGLAEAGHRMEGALVGTVHSVCERLLRRFVFEAGMSPEFRVMPAEEASIFFGESLSTVLAGGDLSRFTAAMERFGIDHAGRLAAVRQIADLARANRIAPESLGVMARESIESYFSLLPPPAAGDHDRALLGQINGAAESIRKKIDDGSDGTKTTSGYVEMLHRAGKALKNGPLPWKMWASLQESAPARKSVELCAGVQAAAARHLSHPLLREDIETVVTTVFSLAAAGLGAYDAWKRERGLIDFTDMEEKVHDLLANEYVARTVGEEYRLLMVDEFQDTSPIQLALFNRLGRAAGNMVWVGDKKQCIYGFRDSDPGLMDAAYDAMSENADIRYLERSYRSRPQLVSLANDIFTAAFGAVGYRREEVALVPAREDNADLSPPIEIWQCEGTNKEQDNAMIARGVRALLDGGTTVIEDRRTGTLRPVVPGDIAVLRRTNNDCVTMADELGALGIRTSVARADLISTAEGKYLLSACEITLEPRASLPAAVVLHLASGGSPESMIDARIGEWLSRGEEGDMPAPWQGHPVLDGLRALSGEARYLSPSELLDRVIVTSGIRDLCLRWSGSEFRTGNVEMFKSYARQYEEYCGFRKWGASFLGLYLYLIGLEGGGEQSAVTSPDSVNIVTYHKAKGREWPVVILGDLDKGLRESIFASSPGVFSAPGTFDFDDPLKGRFIRFWPWPYGAKGNKAPLWQTMMDSELEMISQARSLREEQRLMYVGFTRARDVLVFPLRRTKGSGNPRPVRLEFLNSGLELPTDEPAGVHSCDFGSGSRYDMRMRLFSLDDGLEALEASSGTWFARPDGGAPDRRELFVSASKMGGDAAARVTAEHVLGERVPGNFRREEDDPSFGNAVHAFSAADGPDLDADERVALAGRVLADHGAPGVLAPETLVLTADRLNAFVSKSWPGGVVLKELPLRLKRGGQIVLGIADLVVETDLGLHLIDHKTFPGTGSQCAARAVEYSGQLAAYAEALEKATGKPCATRAVHFPVEGLIVVVK